MAVGRFQVMAILQAARAHELGLPLESAFSWGLDRAIFYAAAKRGFKGKARTKESGTHAGKREQEADTYALGDEIAYKEERDGKLYFVIGGKAQTEKDFEKQIESRFQGSFEEAWDEALDYVRHFDRETLLSGNEFFASVYRPKRDEFAAKWSQSGGGDSKAVSNKRTNAHRLRAG
jgi:hypothetical protein